MMLVDNNSSAAGSRALDLRSEPGRAPLTVNADAGKAANLNADRLDNKSVEQLGVNGYERVRVESAFDSTASKSVHARCPDGKVVVGGGAQVFPSLADPQNARAPIVIRYSTPDAFDESWSVIAEEIADYGFSWWVSSTAICAAAP